MKGKNLLVLVILAAIMVGIAVLSSRKKESAPPEVVGTALLPKLEINDVEKIAVRSALGSVTLARMDDVWCLPSKFKYPAKFEKIKSVLMKLADVRIGQVMMDVDAAQKVALKMQMPPSSTNAPATGSGTVVELFGKGGVNLGAILIGDNRMRKPEGAPQDYRGYPDGRYVSNDGGKSVCLVKEPLDDVTPDAKAWMDAELLNVPVSDISTITMVGTNGSTAKLSRGKDTNRTIVEGLSDTEEADAIKLSNVENALSYLKFDDVADPALSAGAMGLDKPAVFEATTQKGEIYTLKIGATVPGSESRYVKIEAAMMATNAVPAPQPEAKNDESGKPAEPAVDTAVERKETEKKVKELQDKVGKWTYVVASYKAGAMLTPRSELVKKKEEVKKVEAPPTPKVEEPPKEELKKEVAPKPEAPKEQGKKPQESKGGWWKRLWK
jgi:hypothetical protein